MTKDRKRLLIVSGAVVAIIVFLITRKSGTIVQSAAPSNFTFPNVSIPSLDMPARGGIVLNLPALAPSSPYDFGAVSTCMCDGSSLAPSGPAIAFNETTVYNQAAQGPNIYNYFNDISQPSSSNNYAGFASYEN